MALFKGILKALDVKPIMELQDVLNKADSIDWRLEAPIWANTLGAPEGVRPMEDAWEKAADLIAMTIRPPKGGQTASYVTIQELELEEEVNELNSSVQKAVSQPQPKKPRPAKPKPYPLWYTKKYLQ